MKISLLRRRSLITGLCFIVDIKVKKFNLKTPPVKMAGIASKGQCDLVSITVPPKVSMRESSQRFSDSRNVTS